MGSSPGLPGPCMPPSRVKEDMQGQLHAGIPSAVACASQFEIAAGSRSCWAAILTDDIRVPATRTPDVSVIGAAFQIMKVT